ncbi:MAG: hypothetical protein ACE37B_23890 [Ilumatobacter sp.]|uniref:hypothetical protein n=1 Tax=Ilumatobacter sp. TaxID=1967498 RepID=UPI003919D415
MRVPSVFTMSGSSTPCTWTLVVENVPSDPPDTAESSLAAFGAAATSAMSNDADSSAGSSTAAAPSISSTANPTSGPNQPWSPKPYGPTRSAPSACT